MGVTDSAWTAQHRVPWGCQHPACSLTAPYDLCTPHRPGSSLPATSAPPGHEHPLYGGCASLLEHTHPLLQDICIPQGMSIPPHGSVQAPASFHQHPVGDAPAPRGSSSAGLGGGPAAGLMGHTGGGLTRGQAMSPRYARGLLLTEVGDVGACVSGCQHQHHVPHELVEQDMLVHWQHLGQGGGSQPGQAPPQHQHLQAGEGQSRMGEGQSGMLRAVRDGKGTVGDAGGHWRWERGNQGCWGLSETGEGQSEMGEEPSGMLGTLRLWSQLPVTLPWRAPRGSNQGPTCPWVPLSQRASLTRYNTVTQRTAGSRSCRSARAPLLPPKRLWL